MDDKIANLVLERLNRMDERLGNIELDVSVLKEASRRIDSRITSMDHYLAGFYTEQRWCNDEIDSIKQRIFRLEEHNETNKNTDDSDQPQD